MGCISIDSKFLLIFFNQLFDIGNSAGSLIVESINLFRIFQKLSATKTFTAKFSTSCLKMFQWAIDFLHIIADSLFKMRPFTEFESFSIYNYIIPMVIITYITLIGQSERVLASTYIWTYACIAGIGIGIGSIGFYQNTLLLTVLLPAVIVLIVTIICINCHLKSVDKREKAILDSYSDEEKRIRTTRELIERKKDHWKHEEYFRSFTGTKSLFVTCNTLILLIIPYTLYRFKLQIFIGVVSAIVIIVSFIFENIFEAAVFIKLTNFFINCISLLIIPQTEKFVEVMQSEYKNKWQLILGYIANSLLIPIIITVLMIISQYEGLTDKYRTKEDKNNEEQEENNDKFRLDLDSENESKKFNLYTLIELVDIVRQIVFAVVSAYDIIWACIGIEIAWFILIVSVRPYENISEHFISAGSSLIVFVTNIAILISNSKNKSVFNFTITVLIIVFACIPPVLSIIIYFIVDFEKEFEDFDESEDICSFICQRNQPNNEDVKNAEKMISFGIFASPILWFTYGIHFILLVEHYDYYL